MNQPTIEYKASLAWRTASTFCRWGVVIVCLILVPGVALIGQGIGRWLQARTASRWQVPLETAGGDASRGVSAPPSTSRAARRPVRPFSPAESAAMYAGSSNDAPASVGAGGIVPVSHSAPVSREAADFSRFAELEQILRDQGALSYALESDRGSRYAYRFRVVMPPVTPGGRERPIEASGATALEAIQRVVRQLDGGASLR